MRAGMMLAYVGNSPGRWPNVRVINRTHYPLLSLLASMATRSPNMEEAGALCGAHVLQRLGTLIVPTLLPALCAGGLMDFLTAFSELTVSALLWSAGSLTLGAVIYGLEEAGLTTEALALGVVTILLVGIVMTMIDALRPLLPDGSGPWFVSDDEKTSTSKLS